MCIFIHLHNCMDSNSIVNIRVYYEYNINAFTPKVK